MSGLTRNVPLHPISEGSKDMMLTHNGWEVIVEHESQPGEEIRVSYTPEGSNVGVMLTGRIVDSRESITHNIIPEGAILNKLRERYAKGPTDFVKGEVETDLEDLVFHPVLHTRKRRFVVAVDWADTMNAPNTTFLDDTDDIEYLHVRSTCTVQTLWDNETVDYRGIYCAVKIGAN